MNFSEKVVIVTGSSSGIGRAIAVKFSEEGANVVIVGRNEGNLEQVAVQCATLGKRPLIIKADVSKDNDVKNIIDKTISTFGKLDILINNAGVLKHATVLGGKLLETYDEIMQTNLRAVVHLTHLSAPHLVKTKGCIVNMSSVTSMATPPSPVWLNYCVSKAGLDHFTRGVAKELASHGVRVNCVNPGAVFTDLYYSSGYSKSIITPETLAARSPMGKIVEPEEVADLVLYLASDKARSITGAVHVIDNGTLLA